MNRYSAISDDFYVNMNLGTEMELPQQRDTVLHYFERIQKKYPSMRKFYCRDKRDFVLEEDKDRSQYRWATVENRRLCSGQVNPATIEEAMEQHRLVLELAPYMLSVSPLDFTYRGNHNQLVSEALGVAPALERLLDLPGGGVINYEPSLTLSLDETCRRQVRVSIENRTNAFQIRTGEYPEEQLSVYVTARQYGSLNPDETFVQTVDELARLCQDVVDNYVVESVLRPLQRTIALR
jgi:hypothetical protein